MSDLIAVIGRALQRSPAGPMASAEAREPPPSKRPKHGVYAGATGISPPPRPAPEPVWPGAGERPGTTAALDAPRRLPHRPRACDPGRPARGAPEPASGGCPHGAWLRSDPGGARPPPGHGAPVAGRSLRYKGRRGARLRDELVTADRRDAGRADRGRAAHPDRGLGADPGGHTIASPRSMRRSRPPELGRFPHCSHSTMYSQLVPDPEHVVGERPHELHASGIARIDRAVGEARDFAIGSFPPSSRHKRSVNTLRLRRQLTDRGEGGDFLPRRLRERAAGSFPGDRIAEHQNDTPPGALRLGRRWGMSRTSISDERAGLAEPRTLQCRESTDGTARPVGPKRNRCQASREKR